MLKLTLITLLVLGNLYEGEARIRLIDPVVKAGRRGNVYGFAASDPSNIAYNWTTKYDFQAYIDNFGYTNGDTFTMKYLYNTDWYKPGNPIFFYTGNEDYIENFAENTGIIWDLAQHFNACVVFAEHRYYSNDSKYKPFGDLAYKNATYLGYLTSEQALADYARFIPWFKTKVLNCSSDTPVIAFGGSYGGMLATWFRLKYPQVVNGSWASSAPVTYFKNGGADLGAFDHKATQTFLDSGCSFDTIVKAFSALDTFANNLDALNNIFHANQSCRLTDATDIFTLKTWVRYAFEYMAMTDYPYYTNFFMPMPAWPASEMCKHLGYLSTEQFN